MFPALDHWAGQKLNFNLVSQIPLCAIFFCRYATKFLNNCFNLLTKLMTVHSGSPLRDIFNIFNTTLNLVGPCVLNLK